MVAAWDTTELSAENYLHQNRQPIYKSEVYNMELAECEL